MRYKTISNHIYILKFSNPKIKKKLKKQDFLWSLTKKPLFLLSISIICSKQMWIDVILYHLINVNSHQLTSVDVRNIIAVHYCISTKYMTGFYQNNTKKLFPIIKFKEKKLHFNKKKIGTYNQDPVKTQALY